MKHYFYFTIPKKKTRCLGGLYIFIFFSTFFQVSRHKMHFDDQILNLKKFQRSVVNKEVIIFFLFLHSDIAKSLIPEPSSLKVVVQYYKV